jgi:ectoine hydroxylase-related dioxygenase (phytanoyl-CoA dioxygenase family)
MPRPGEARWPETLEARFDALGVAIIEYALTKADVARMDAAFPVLPTKTAGARAEAFPRDTRDWLAAHEALCTLAGRLIGGGDARAVALTRLQAFDTSAAANWFVPWHQDRASDGCERAVSELERTVALRIHLDDCDEDNGPLEVLAGSHVHGRLTADAIAEQVAVRDAVLCLAVRGDIVALRPLAVHRSQRARNPRHRRVLHLEFTARAVGS